MQHRGVNIGHVMRVFHRMKPQLVRPPVGIPPFDAGPTKPDRKTMRMVVATGALIGPAFQARRSPEFGTAND